MRIVTLLVAFYALVTAAWAENILFIGNSFTIGSGDPAISHHGSLPMVVQTIAKSQGDFIFTGIVATGGKNWAFHLANPATDAGLQAKRWDWVVLQDFSTEPTHIGDVAEFMKDGRAFSDRIAKESPGAGIVLFETWALGPKNPAYAPGPATQKFTSPDQMLAELQKNYAALAVALHHANPARPVRVAEVGRAFALCEKEYPEITLFSKGDHHAQRNGSYLAALVIYATIFNSSPQGATAVFPDFTIDPATAKRLQNVATEVWKSRTTLQD